MSLKKSGKNLGRSETQLRVDALASILEEYAQRGVFRGYSQAGEVRQGRAVFHLLWHRNRVFELIFDPSRKTLCFPTLLPHVPAEMHRDLRKFIKARQAEEMPEHRRIEPSKARLTATRREGEVALTLYVLDGDEEYGARKLIHLVHEIFLTFLYDGRYYDYMVENFDLDPDRF